MASKLYEIAFQIGGKLQGSLGKSMATAAGQLDSLGRKIANLEKAQGTSTRFRALKNEIGETQQKLRQAEAELRKLDGEMRRTSAPTAAMSRQFATAQARVEALRGQFRGQVVELRSVKSAMMAAGMSTRTLAADQQKLAANLARTVAQQKKLRENLAARSANSERLANARSQMGEARGRIITGIAAVAPFALAVRTAAKFEDAMTRVGSLARASDADLARLSETAQVLGRDTKYSATQAAEGMQFLAMAGYNVNQTIQAMPGMLNIANAGAVELGTAADIVSNVLSGFGMRAEETTRLGDVLANTFTRSNVNLEMLGETMKYVAPVSKATGVSLEMTAAAAGLLGNSGIQGSMAGTALRTMLSRLAAPMRKGQRALERLGVKTKDAAGNLRPLEDVLVDLQKKMSRYGTATRQGMTTAIFGMEAATAATVLMGEAGSGALQKFSREVAKQGTAQMIADKQAQTSVGRYLALKSAIEGTAIKIGNALLPALQRLSQRIIPVINSVTSWMEKNPELASTIVGVAAGLSVLVLGLAVAGYAFTGAKVAILAAKGAMLLLNVATLKAAAAFAVANAPIALAIAGVAGLIYAGNELRKNWGAIQDWWDGMWDGMYDKIAGIINKIAPVLRWLGIDVGEMQTGKNVFSKARYSQRYFSDMAEKSAKFQAWTPKETVDQGPTWLKKAGELQPASGAKVEFNQSITVPPGTPDQVKQSVRAAGKMGLKDLEDAIGKLNAQGKRVSFE